MMALIDGTFRDIGTRLCNSGNLHIWEKGGNLSLLFQIGWCCWVYYKPSFAENSHQTMDKDDVHVITREMSRSQTQTTIPDGLIDGLDGFDDWSLTRL